MQVVSPAGEIEHDVGDLLSRTMPCVAAAAPGAVDRNVSGIDEFVIPRARSRREEARMFEQPYRLRRLAGANAGSRLFHGAHRIRIVHRPVAHLPANRCHRSESTRSHTQPGLGPVASRPGRICRCFHVSSTRSGRRVDRIDITLIPATKSRGSSTL